MISQQPPTATGPVPPGAERPVNTPIAIVGADCRMPGARNLAEYWELIIQGRSAIAPVPDDRLDRSLYFDPQKGKLGKTYSDLAGLADEEPFDAQRLPISDEIRANADPVHLRMLEVCAAALRSAGYDPLGMPRTRAGVYMGHTGGSCLAADMTFHTYAAEVAHVLQDEDTFRDLPAATRDRIAAELVEKIRQDFPGRKPGHMPNLSAHDVSILVNRVFGFDGPAVAIDAACASSLIAMAQAIVALQQGHIDLAIAGGCSYTKWYVLSLFSQAQSMSSTGTRPFDANADGLISSDGYAAVILKTLPQALADGDHIWGVVRDFNVASDGRGKSLWAPRREGQVATVRNAYRGAVSPASIQYMECHATSTQVGDATEITALAEAFRDRIPAGKKIPIGSVKGNVGHTLECAGVAGLLKVLLSLKHGVIPPQANLKSLNPEIPWDEIPFYVPTEQQPWPAPNEFGVRRAAVNAFGIGGLNSHFIIDDRPEPGLPMAGAPKVKSEPPQREPIAIIGMGAIVPGAQNVSDFWKLIESGRPQFCEAPADRWTKELYQPGNLGGFSIQNAQGGFIRDYAFDWKRHRVPPKQIATANPLQFMLLDAAEEALRDAGLMDREFNRGRTSVVVGTIFGGDFSCHLQMGLRLAYLKREIQRMCAAAGVARPQVEDVLKRYEKLLLQRMPSVMDETGSFTSSTLASRLTKAFDLMGGAWAMDSSDASSLVALQSCMDLLRTGNSDVVLCASGQRTMDLTFFEMLSMEDMSSHGPARPPFDAGQSGFLPGEGVGVVVLKRLSDAVRDGDRVRGVIRDVSVSYDIQFGQETLARNIAMTMGREVSAAHRDPFDMIEVARVQLDEADAPELTALDRALPAVPGRPMTLSSLNSQIGYSLGAAGMLSLIKAVLEIENGSVPRAAGATHGSSLLDGQKFRLADQTIPLPSGQQTTPARRGLVANGSRSGLIAHLCVENMAAVESRNSRPEPAVEAVPTAHEMAIVRLGAKSLDQLMQSVEAMVAAGTTAGTDAFGPDDAARLAVLGKDHADVLKKLKMASTGLSAAQKRHVLSDQALFVQERPQGFSGTAVLFSGQGAQYTGMLKDWYAASPSLANRVQAMNVDLAACGMPSVETLCWDESAELGQHVLNTQLSVLVADLLSWEILKELGVEPSVISGHSYGEFPALVAAGAWSFRDAIRATIARTNAVENCQIGEAVMLSTSAPLDAIRTMIASSGVAVDIACMNSPTQSILAGRTDDIAVIETALREAGFASRPIRVPRPYHSRLMTAAKAPFAAELARIPVSPPSIRFVSSGSLQELTTADDVRQALVDQLTEPVRYQALIEQLTADGITVLLESGPKQILTRLNRQILTDVPALHACIDARPRAVAEQRQRLQLLQEAARFPVSQAHSTAMPVRQTRSVESASRASFPSPTTPIASMKESDSSRPAGEVIWVDATERRREKMRLSSQSRLGSSGGQKPSSPRPELTVSFSAGQLESSHGAYSAGHQNYGGNGNGNGHGHAQGNGHGHALADRLPVSAGTEAIAQGNGAHHSASKLAEANGHTGQLVAQQHAPAEAATRALGGFVDVAQLRDKLEQFSLNFVVEQTGYPTELVELDADLEADLGIDSIRKAQLLGEVAEQFGLKERALAMSETSLDDLPTLRSIVNFFSEMGSETNVASPTAVTTTAAPVAEVRETAAPASVSAEAMTATASPAPALAPATAPAALDRTTVEEFAVNFVIEQTGYPAELVELEADLEADLGIDSIRKAQLMGEIAERFNRTEVATQMTEMSLDDFPTLSSIVDFFCELAPLQEPAAAVAPVTENAPPAAVTLAATDMVMPAPAVAPSTPAPAGLDRQEVADFAVNFVIEQTGYPAELVELEADLEADLGIDSIRKAQLMGEIAERFNRAEVAMQMTEMSLDDFPTLSSIVDFFCELSPATSSSAPFPVPNVAETSPVVMPAPAPVAANTSPQRPPGAETLDRQEVAEFAVNFVIEQTGYPAELVELEADLEADLGIDSIRKAQLMGEIAERFNRTEVAMQMTEMSLDDFPTLNSIVDFFCELSDGSNAAASGTVTVESSTVAAEEHAEQHVEEPACEPFSRTPEADRTMRRYILRMIAEALPEVPADARPFAGNVLIVGNSPVTEPLKSKLESLGSHVRVMTPDADWNGAVETFNQLWTERRVDHMVLLTSDHGVGNANWTETRDRELLVPYFLCQRWIQLWVETKQPAGPVPNCLCAVTRMGGDFGLSGRSSTMTGGALTGLFKGIRREFPSMVLKVIDAPADEPARLIVDGLLNEAAVPTESLEVGCIRGKRHRLRVVPRPAASISTRPESLDGPWVVTGGARGITARIAQGLGSHPGVKLHLLGRSAAPHIPDHYRGLDAAGMDELKKQVMRDAAANKQKPIDAWNAVSREIELDRSLNELRAAGLDVTYHACDVADRSMVESVLTDVRRQHGPIRGVIHGAGYENAARFERKKPDSVLKTVSTKVDGAEWLWQLTQDDPLHSFVAFGSTAGRFGGLGQSDYSMSSDLLCRMCADYRAQRPDCRVIAVHWPPWAEIGMAARPESKFALEASGLKFLPPDEGVSHLLDEIDADCSDVEVTYIDGIWSLWDDELRWDAAMADATRKSSSHVRSLGYVDGIVDVRADQVTTETRFDPVRDEILRDHQYEGVPLVPAAVMLEMCCQTAQLLEPGCCVRQVNQFEIQHGIRFYSDSPRCLQTTVSRRMDGTYDCRLHGEFVDAQGRIVEADRTYALARVMTDASSALEAAAMNPPADYEPLNRASSTRDYDRAQVGDVYHGPALGALSGVHAVSETEAWFRIDVTAASQDAQAKHRCELASPLVIDAVLQALQVLRHRHHREEQLPIGHESLLLNPTQLASSEVVFARLRVTSQEPKLIVFDADLVDADGKVLAQLRQSRMGLKKRQTQSEGVADAVPLRPLLTVASIARSGETLEVHLKLDPMQVPFLNHHRLKGTAILPGVVGVELAMECAEHLAGVPGRSMVVENFVVHSGIQFPGEKVRELLVRCHRQGQGIQAEIFESPQARHPSMTGTVIVNGACDELDPLQLTPALPFSEFEYPTEVILEHGPALQTLKQLAAYRLHGWSELAKAPAPLMSGLDASPNWIFDPALLDGAIISAGVDTWLWLGGAVAIPAMFEKIVIGPEAGKCENAHVLFQYQTHTASNFVYDISIFDENGRAQVFVHNYQAVAIDAQAEELAGEA